LQIRGKFDRINGPKWRIFARNLGLLQKGDIFVNTTKLDKQGSNVKMIAHRGLSGLEQENTCAAFVAAGNRETYFGIETDVHRTADGQFVIIHDDNTVRVSGVELKVEETDMQTLRQLRLQDKGGQSTRWDLVLPSLEEYIGICKRYEKTAVLELKNPMPEEDVCRIMETIARMEYTDRLIVISFSLDNLIYLRRHYPEQAAQYLLSSWKDGYIDILKEHNLGLDIYYPAVTSEVVEKVHGIGQEVNCWTVDKPEDAARMIACGVDYITSNILE